eukprot:CAMPEP_0174272268 /NCGR_PEP_ID=MMETSP0439-20130205/50695_1 /TAXON_ID=0 /ORGANISM="Stereomyxa ramosa, Strain Chinc5" /LENGTH=315 /DNA_ID=CAMNT_0015362741 /DNA_START=299 /DNA_END=1243 /DNA_ORIENTATION=+
MEEEKATTETMEDNNEALELEAASQSKEEDVVKTVGKENGEKETTQGKKEKRRNTECDENDQNVIETDRNGENEAKMVGNIQTEVGKEKGKNKTDNSGRGMEESKGNAKTEENEERQHEKQEKVEGQRRQRKVVLSMDRFRAGKLMYYLQQSPVSNFKNLHKDFFLPSLFDKIPGCSLGSNTIFIGSTGLRTTMHYDRPLVDNLFCQIKGKKRFRLWKPEQGKYFYPYHFDTGYGHVSKIPEIDPPHMIGIPGLVKGQENFDDEQEVVDSSEFPLYSKAELYADFILEPGDMLYIPKGYWHHVTHVTHSISMNFW